MSRPANPAGRFFIGGVPYFYGYYFRVSPEAAEAGRSYLCLNKHHSYLQ